MFAGYFDRIALTQSLTRLLSDFVRRPNSDASAVANTARVSRASFLVSDLAVITAFLLIRADCVKRLVFIMLKIFNN